jgi:hypothetical protein
LFVKMIGPDRSFTIYHGNAKKNASSTEQPHC